MKDNWESIAGSLASWVQPSSCGPGLPPPPGSGSPAWGKGPSRGTALVAGEDALSGSTAPKHWRLWSSIWKKQTTCKRSKQRTLNCLYDASISSPCTTQYRPSVNTVCNSQKSCELQMCGLTIVQWASREHPAGAFLCGISEIYEFKALL